MKHILALLVFMSFSTVMAHQGHDHTPPKAPTTKPAGCDLWFAAHTICAKINFLAPPKANVNSPFEILFLDKDGQPTTHDPVFVDLWMNMGGHGGHGSAPVKLSYVGEGLYSVDNVYFVMKGPWQIRATIGHTTHHAETDIYNLTIQ